MGQPFFRCVAPHWGHSMDPIASLGGHDMRRFLILALLAAPVEAPAQSTTEDGLGLVERGMGIIAENLLKRWGPELDRLGRDMDGALSDLAPLLDDLAGVVDDLGNYEAPERLENGDVLIRRKPGAPPPPPLGKALPQPGDPARPRIPIDPDQPEIPL